MTASSIFLRLRKLLDVIKSPRLTWALLKHGVLAGAEHRWIFPPGLQLVVDIGANRGQFALAARQWAPEARVVAFEPLPGPAATFAKVFSRDDRVSLHQVAIGPKAEQRTMHVSKKDDSSSMLPISLQSTIFPGTEEVATATVSSGPLHAYLPIDELAGAAMIKLDVQGFEYEALLGCSSMLPKFTWLYCECSFVELYSGQKLAPAVIALLASYGFLLAGVHNPSFDSAGRCVQADLLFRASSGLRTEEDQFDHRILPGKARDSEDYAIGHISQQTLPG